MTRLAIFGLDGADPDLLTPWLDQGKLPCLARLRRKGRFRPLASTIPPMSPEAWCSFSTGTNPGKHGVVNFVQPKPGSYDLAFCSGAMRKGDTFWRLVGQAGLRVGIVNIPMTYPPEAVNGFMISGPDTPGVQSQFTYPATLKSELTAAIGPYDLHGDYWGRVTAAEYEQRLTATVANQAKAWEYLLKRYKPDIFVGVFGSTDRAQHFLWDHREETNDALLAVYQAADRAIASCLQLLGEEVVVIIISDHGAGPCDSVIYLDRWLEAQGLLHYRTAQDGVGRGIFRRSYELARRFLPRRAKDYLKSRLGNVRQNLEGSVLRDPIDWPRTRAFFLGTESAYLYLNTKGRFPEGAVNPGSEADGLREQIATELLSLRDPETGESVVEAVHRREQLYRGDPEQVTLLPDLVVCWKDYRYVVRRARGERDLPRDVIVARGIKGGDAGRLMSLELSACHRPHGILLAAGPGIEPGGDDMDSHIFDLAPTILSLLGLQIPANMDGKIIPWLTAARFKATP